MIISSASSRPASYRSEPAMSASRIRSRSWPRRRARALPAAGAGCPPRGRKNGGTTFAAPRPPGAAAARCSTGSSSGAAPRGRRAPAPRRSTPSAHARSSADPPGLAQRRRSGFSSRRPSNGRRRAAKSAAAGRAAQRRRSRRRPRVGAAAISSSRRTTISSPNRSARPGPRAPPPAARASPPELRQASQRGPVARDQHDGRAPPGDRPLGDHHASVHVRRQVNGSHWHGAVVWVRRSSPPGFGTTSRHPTGGPRTAADAAPPPHAAVPRPSPSASTKNSENQHRRQVTTISGPGDSTSPPARRSTP